MGLSGFGVAPLREGEGQERSASAPLATGLAQSQPQLLRGQLSRPGRQTRRRGGIQSGGPHRPQTIPPPALLLLQAEEDVLRWVGLPAVRPVDAINYFIAVQLEQELEATRQLISSCAAESETPKDTVMALPPVQTYVAAARPPRTRPEALSGLQQHACSWVEWDGQGPGQGRELGAGAARASFQGLLLVSP